MTKSSLYSAHLSNPKVRIIRNGLIAAVLIFFSALVLFPLVYMVAWSFGPNVQMSSSLYTVFPKTWTLESYQAIFAFSEYAVKWLWNSFVVAACTAVCNVIFASMAGYAFAKIRFKGNTFLFFLILVAMMIPYQVTQVPLYILIVNKFQMNDTYAALILPGCATAYNIFLAKQFFSGLPTALIESAKVEGASHIRIFANIVLPLSKTILAVMAINTFVANWNTFFWPFLVTSKESMFTIQVALKTFKSSSWTLLSPMMAGATVSALPIFILFFALQKYFLEGVTVGAVKG